MRGVTLFNRRLLIQILGMNLSIPMRGVTLFNRRLLVQILGMNLSIPMPLPSQCII